MNQVLAKEAINTLTTTSEQDIINQTMFNSETRKSKASEFVDLTIATALDYSSSAPSVCQGLVSTLPCHTPIAASCHIDGGSADSVLHQHAGSDDSCCMTPASSIFIPLAQSINRAFSTSLSPLDETMTECTRTDLGQNDDDKNNDGTSPASTTD